MSSLVMLGLSICISSEEVHETTSNPDVELLMRQLESYQARDFEASLAKLKKPPPPYSGLETDCIQE